MSNDIFKIFWKYSKFSTVVGSPFLCLLHINFWVLTGVLMLLKAKYDHLQQVCSDGLAHWWWRWSRLAFSLFTAYQILSCNFYFQGVLHTAITDAVYCVKLVVPDRRVANNVQIRCEMTWQIRFSKLQYNTCGGRNDVKFSAPTTSFDHVIWSICDHIVSLLLVGKATCGGWCVSSLFSMRFFSDDKAILRCIFAPQNDDHISFSRTRIWPHSWP